jgi:hypothetical protein
VLGREEQEDRRGIERGKLSSGVASGIHLLNILGIIPFIPERNEKPDAVPMKQL